MTRVNGYLQKLRNERLSRMEKRVRRLRPAPEAQASPSERTPEACTPDPATTVNRPDLPGSIGPEDLEKIRAMRARVDQCIDYLLGGESNDMDEEHACIDEGRDRTAGTGLDPDADPAQTLLADVRFIRAGMKLRLAAAGYRTVGDIAASTPEGIVADLGTSLPIQWAKGWIDAARRMVGPFE